MDIYTAGNAMNKVSKFIESYSNSPHNMYQSTKSRMTKIRSDAAFTVSKIDSMLSLNTENGDESKKITSVDSLLKLLIDIQSYIINNLAEIQNSTNNSDIVEIVSNISSLLLYTSNQPDIQETLNNILSEISNLKIQIAPSDYSDFDTTDMVESNNIPSLEEGIGTLDSSNVGISECNGKKDLMKTYFDTLENLSSSKCPYKSIQPLIDLIHDWYSTRFRFGYSYRSSNMRQWILSIITTYSISLSKRESDKYIEDFRTWLKYIDKHPKNKYTLPYVVYKDHNNPDPHFDYTAAQIVFDILYDNGFKPIVRDESLYLSDDDIVNWATKHNLSTKYDYNYYKSQKDILKSCNIY